MKNIKFKRKKGNSVLIIAIVCVLLCGILVAAGFLIAKNAIDKNEEEQLGYTFSYKGFEGVSSVKCLNQEMAVFTDRSSGLSGIITLGGKVTEKAAHTEISVCSDAWGSYRYIVETPASEYLLLVDTQTKTVTNRQYHGLQSPELIPCWSEAANHLAWTDDKGYAGEIESSELGLEEGLYPVANSLKEGAKWGFFNESLRLEIPLIFDKAGNFSNGLAPAKKDGKWGYVDKNGATAIPFEFDSCAAADAMKSDFAFEFRNGLAPVCKNGKFGIINTEGETVVDFSFDVILQGENGVYIAQNNGAWGLITVLDKHLSPETTTAASTDGGPAIERGNYIVKTSGSVLNFRKTADSQSIIIGKIPNGTELTVTKSVSGWAYVTYNSARGWVSSEFLVAVEEKTTIIG